MINELTPYNSKKLLYVGVLGAILCHKGYRCSRGFGSNDSYRADVFVSCKVELAKISPACSSDSGGERERVAVKLGLSPRDE